MQGVYGEIIFVGIKDGGCDCEGFFEATLGEEEFGL